MQVACPICWHSVWTAVECKNCGLIQCLEYEGPKCIACGGSCKIQNPNKLVETTVVEVSAEPSGPAR